MVMIEFSEVNDINLMNHNFVSVCFYEVILIQAMFEVQYLQDHNIKPCENGA